MAAGTDLNLQKLVTDFLVHEEARVERLDGVSGKDLEAALHKAQLMPRHIVTDAAHHLADLIEYETEDGAANPVYEHNKLQLEEAIEKKKKILLHWAKERKEGRGWSREYIESSFTQYVVQKLEAMALAIQTTVDKKRSSSSAATQA